MATFNSILKGLEIFAKYGDDDCLVSATHDLIYVGLDGLEESNHILSEEDRKKLKDLGWHWEENVCSWAIFV